MKKLLLFILLTTLLFSKSIEVVYDVKFGLFGEVGDAKGVFSEDGETYSVEIDATSSGFARFISNNRKESHRSYGVIKDGVLRSDTYIQEVSTNSSYTLSTFTIDHNAKKVYKNNQKKRWNLNKELIEDSDNTREEPYYADNDLLTLFFNLKNMINILEKEGRDEGVLYAVGANKKDGAVDIVLPKGEGLESAQKLLQTDSDKIVIATLNQKIFGSEKGELAVLLDDEYLAQKAVLKDVMLFGDVRGEMIKKEERD